MAKMNKEQIVKALECCSELRLCVDCPMRAEGYFSHSGNACRRALMQNALSIIREQENRIEELEASCTEIARNLHACKAETVRKMQELLCEDRVSNDPVVIAVNVAANQLWEENT